MHVHAFTLPPTSKKFMGRCFDPECSVITVPCTASEGIRHSGWFFICLSLECCPTNMPKWCVPNTCHLGVVSWNNETALILTLKPWSVTKAAKCFDSRCIKYDSGGSCNWSDHGHMTKLVHSDGSLPLCFGRSQASKHRRRTILNSGKMCMTTVIMNQHQINV